MNKMIYAIKGIVDEHIHILTCSEVRIDNVIANDQDKKYEMLMQGNMILDNMMSQLGELRSSTDGTRDA